MYNSSFEEEVAKSRGISNCVKLCEYVEIKLEMCENSTENNNHCYPKEFIQSSLKGKFFSVAFKNHFFS